MRYWSETDRVKRISNSRFTIHEELNHDRKIRKEREGLTYVPLLIS